ncbi:Bcr/CflA family multidrug efflux MFS transporter [Marinobacterium sediminicola]|uniref:Bcr/CflA family efflux transporter n=1 Tax=Marinobacterium sediminicola TaxID=518898 RepID=A0ABY1S2D8_9GAMM|nr:Bcr/CflA family multidrug efflux MFS transporter [Marinobacterium sediminicola]ULG68463.1 Bcr/CflA family multidrug efflux MFS transporter [Marinobacterium sediminicola]SMR76780.1 MFS transporter, DHA1 family, bicyclomycin/chloramphenicol resistance protein [Marinobacterium sediminicola]
MSSVANPKRLIVLLAALVAFGPLSIDMYLPSLPLIAEDLQAPESSIQLTISAFLIGLFIGMLFYGPLSDKFGRRGLLLGGIGLYLVATIGCILADSAEWLIAARFMQALGGAAASVLARAIVRDLFPLNEAARVLSLMHLVTMIATLIAPLIGGYLILISGWRSLFMVLFAFAALMLVFSAWKIPETHHGDSRNASILAVFKAYLQIGMQPVAIGYILCMGLTFAGMFSYITASPFVYIEYFGVSPQHYAWFFSLNIGGIIVLVSLNARYVGRFGTQKLLVAGAGLAALSGLVLIFAGTTGLGGLPLIVAGLLGFVSVTGVLGSNCMASLLSRYPQQAGAAAGLAVACQFGLGALASSTTGALHDGSPLPMTLIIGLTGVGSLAALALTRNHD